MQRDTPLRLLLLLLPALLLVPVCLPAQDAPPISGGFVLDREASDDLEAAIRRYTSSMNRITAIFARRLIRNTNRPYEWIQVEVGEESVSITTPGRQPIVTSRDGSPQEWIRDEDNRTFTVRTFMRDGRLHQVFTNDDGQRENVFSLAQGGDVLRMDVTLTSPRRDLPDPMRYRLVFRRQR